MRLIRVVESKDITMENISKYIPRIQTQLDEIKEDVLKIIEDVKNNGDNALINYSIEFDNVGLKQAELRVSQDEINEAYNLIDKELLVALRYSKENLIKYHKAQIRQMEDFIQIEKGVYATQIYRPLNSVGLYIPGGRAIYPSTVLMAATPAYVAGVANIILCTPPQKNKKIAPEILVAANEFDIKDIFKVGGAQAIAAMAYGTETIPNVLKVIGPGNKWVNAAKQLLSNVISIDSPAGPSEVLIIADETADYHFVITDLISQVEHDPDNIGVIISNSPKLINKILENLEDYVDNSIRKDIIRTALKKNSLIIKADNIMDCYRICNLIAPEHLELLVRDEREALSHIQNAGAIFLGPYSPVPLGDYCAGTNHILPTGGAAKKYSGLNVHDFFKLIDVLECSKKGLEKLSKYAMKIAEFEGLFAHKRAIEERLKDKN
ncbi:MAG: histidinol dehydrogenase [Promethearchaeota archaeon]